MATAGVRCCFGCLCVDVFVLFFRAVFREEDK